MRNLKRALSLALASVMLLGMMVVGTSASYPDVDAADNLEAIEVLQAVGIMKGDEKGNFNPDKMVTRNEMAVVMCNLLGLKAGGTAPFVDVPAWAQGYVAACYNNDIIAGVSATMFNGDANVTAVQAGLMVMKALGYFGYQGEFGENWKVAVAKQANKIDLYDGIDRYTDADMTRNDVAQLVLNALQADVMVVTEHGGLNVQGEGFQVSEKAWYEYDHAQDKNNCNYNKQEVDDGYLQLCEKLYGSDLKKNGAAEDDFGRPANEWTYDKESIKTAKNPTLTYTKGVKGKDIYADLGKPADVKDYIYYVDGAPVDEGEEELVLKGMDDELGGNGVLMEVYYDKDEDLVTVVLVNTYVGEVSDCEKNDDGKYDITFAGNEEEGLTTFESDVAFEADDVVLYTIAGEETKEVKTMTLTKKLTGEVTYVKTDKNFKVDGTTYSYSANLEGAKLATAAVDSDVDFYLDAYGYVIKIGEASSSTNYAVVMATTAGSWTGTDVDEQAKLFFADGTVKAVSVKSLENVSLGDIVSYTVNSKDEYELTAVAKLKAAENKESGAKTGSMKIETGKATATIDGTANYIANSKTVFFFYNSDSKTYEAYTGIKNVPNTAAAGGEYAVAIEEDGNLLKAVYVQAGKDLKEGTAADVASFLFVDNGIKPEKDSDLGDYYVVNAVVDGKATELKVEAGLLARGGDLAEKGAFMVSKMTTNDKGIVTDVTVETTAADLGGEDKGYLEVAKMTAAKDEIIVLGDKAYTYADDCKVFEYDVVDKEFTAKTVKALKTVELGAEIYAQVKDSTVIAIYTVEKHMA